MTEQDKAELNRDLNHLADMLVKHHKHLAFADINGVLKLVDIVQDFDDNGILVRLERC